ncbi:hypothetical protein MKEN_01497900 [Mycena kentingensis (nom. inval.)]|nr:hypothetical protein MKEN_01497900 [Mycena kentingensis (nom. inval.)]
MTRCESPNGAVEFCYDFPVASTSKRPTHTRARSPRRHAPSPLPPTRWDSDDEEDEAYDDYSYRAHTTGNQWARAPSPSFTPSHLSPYDIYATSALPSSYESERSVLSSFCHRQQHAHAHTHNKIRKARRSVDEPAPPPLSTTYSSGSSAPSSPFSVLSDDFSDMEEEECVEEEGMDVEGEEEGRAPHALKKQWAALSLRVRFGVFRAKRRMRDRGLSL